MVMKVDGNTHSSFELKENCVAVDMHQEKTPSLESLNEKRVQEHEGSDSLEDDHRGKNSIRKSNSSKLHIDLKEMILQRVSSFPLVNDSQSIGRSEFFPCEGKPFLRENRTHSAEAGS